MSLSSLRRVSCFRPRNAGVVLLSATLPLILSLPPCAEAQDNILELEFALAAELYELEAPVIEAHLGKLELLRDKYGDTAGIGTEQLFFEKRLETLRQFEAARSGDEGSRKFFSQPRWVLSLEANQARVYGRTYLAPNGESLAGWDGGQARWSLPKMLPGIWHIIVEYSKVPSGPNTNQFSFQLGPYEKQSIALKSFPNTKGWDSFTTKYLGRVETEPEKSASNLVFACGREGSAEALNLRRVLLVWEQGEEEAPQPEPEAAPKLERKKEAEMEEKETPPKDRKPDKAE